MTVTVMITTRNRSTQLRLTLQQVRRLDPAPAEVIVTADGCSDETASVVMEEFPGTILVVNETGQGSVASRARMMDLANGDLVLSLDDDSYPEQMDFLAKLEEVFRCDERIAVVTFPQRSDEYPESLATRHYGVTREVRSFPNSGACFRMSVYRELPGFEPMFFHMYEEPDYALQCVGANRKIVYYPGLTIRHHWTPNQRSELRNHHLHARNELWSTLLRCPLPQALGVILYRMFSQARYARKRGLSWLIREPSWWWAALVGLRGVISRRHLVSWDRYRYWTRLPD